MKTYYKIFANGWYNPKSKNIIDKWKGTVNGEERQVIITKGNEE